MEVILFETVEKLGMQGEVVNVASGYFRNYLGPHNIAVEATPGNLKRLEIKRRRLQEEAEKQVGEAEKLAERLAEQDLTFVMKATEKDKLFGSVHDHEIAERLRELGFSVERRQVLLPDPIKTVGDHKVQVQLVGTVAAQVTVQVKSEKETEQKTGTASPAAPEPTEATIPAQPDSPKAAETDPSDG